MYSYWRYFILLWHVTDAKCVLPKMRKNRQLSHLMAIFSALNMPTCVILFYTGSRKLCWDYFSEYFFFTAVATEIGLHTIGNAFLYSSLSLSHLVRKPLPRQFWNCGLAVEPRKQITHLLSPSDSGFAHSSSSQNSMALCHHPPQLFWLQF